MSGLEGLLVAAPLVWLGLVTAQQWQRWRALRRPADWATAEARARALLDEMLTAEEQALLADRGYLELPSKLVPGRRYRVYPRSQPVAVYEGGRRVQSLCVQPTSYLPPSDHLLLHKLLIEGDERRYLRLANVSRLGRLEFPLPGASPILARRRRWLRC